jgi:acetylornithine deacetylase
MQAELQLLKELIAIPSISREEQATAEHIHNYLKNKGVESSRIYQNIWAKHPQFEEGRFTLLLNSHHDTVKPAVNYTRDPFFAEIADGKLYGLGSNDAGISVVGLIHCFLHYYKKDLPFNLILAISAEEEVMGETGMRTLFAQLPQIDGDFREKHF